MSQRMARSPTQAHTLIGSDVRVKMCRGLSKAELLDPCAQFAPETRKIIFSQPRFSDWICARTKKRLISAIWNAYARAISPIDISAYRDNIPKHNNNSRNSARTAGNYFFPTD